MEVRCPSEHKLVIRLNVLLFYCSITIYLQNSAIKSDI